MKRVSLRIAASVFALGIAAAFGASAATEVELKDMAAKVVVTPENRSDVELKVVYGTNKLPVIMVHTEGNKFVADGKLKYHSLDCKTGNDVDVSGIGLVGNADLPTVYVKVPMDAKVSAGGAIFGTLGATQTLELNHGGCGGWTVGNVAGHAEVNIGGSGDVTMGTASDAEVNIGGSGNFKSGAITKLDANIGGNGDINVDRVNGDTSVNIGGSGNVVVTDGVAPNLEVNIAGSGDVRFGGEAHDVSVSIVGSGDVRIKKVTGKVDRSIMGSGNVLIGQ